MKVIQKLRIHHGNNITDVKSNFICFKSEKKCFISLEYFLRLRDRKKPKDKVLENSKFLTLYFLKTIFLVFFQRFFDFNTENFKVNDRLRHLMLCLILGKEFWKAHISKTACPNLKIFQMNFKIM